MVLPMDFQKKILFSSWNRIYRHTQIIICLLELLLRCRYKDKDNTHQLIACNCQDTHVSFKCCRLHFSPHYAFIYWMLKQLIILGENTKIIQFKKLFLLNVLWFTSNSLSWVVQHKQVDFDFLLCLLSESRLAPSFAVVLHWLEEAFTHRHLSPGLDVH